MSEVKLESSSDEGLGSIDVSEMTAKRAHEIFESRGGEHGRALDDWLQAEREVQASLNERVAGITPASAQAVAATADAPTGVGMSESRESKRGAAVVKNR